MVSPSARRLLDLLKERGELSLGDLAGASGVSKVAILRHLRGLERSGLIDRAYRVAGVGRPQVFFRLAPPSAGLFPSSYRELSQSALSFVERRFGRGAVAELFQERAAEFLREHGKQLRTGPLRDRVQELARIRTEGGYLAAVGERRPGRVEMIERNCPILALAGRYPEACETERRMFAAALGARVETSHRVVAGDPLCRFLIRAEAART